MMEEFSNTRDFLIRREGVWAFGSALIFLRLRKLFCFIWDLWYIRRGKYVYVHTGRLWRLEYEEQVACDGFLSL